MAPRKTSLAIIAVASLAAQSAAHPEFRQKIPNALNVKGVDAIGHVSPAGGGARNKFGLAFAAAGLQWTKALCQADSDGDGQTNGQELGDPCCEWVQTTNAKVLWSVGVSAPGDAASKSDPKLWANVKCNGTTTTTAPTATTAKPLNTTTTAPATTTVKPLNSTATTTAPPATTTPAATTKAPNTTVPSATKTGGAVGVSVGAATLALGLASTAVVLFV